MGTPSLMRQAFTPYRTAEIIALARATAELYCGCTIDAVAERCGIILKRIASPESGREGFSCIITATTPKRFRSQTSRDQMRFSFAEEEQTRYPSIIINSACVRNEAVVFWHEYYHIWYSPSRNTSASFFSNFSTVGVLDTQEERRANLFAAAVLIDTIEPRDTPETIAERYAIDPALAELRIKAERLGHTGNSGPSFGS